VRCMDIRYTFDSLEIIIFLSRKTISDLINAATHSRTPRCSLNSTQCSSIPEIRHVDVFGHLIFLGKRRRRRLKSTVTTMCAESCIDDFPLSMLPTMSRLSNKSSTSLGKPRKTVT